ncbi:MAG: PQQ-dependent sugar dehydrogenase [Gemmatimonadaceae bacterium]
MKAILAAAVAVIACTDSAAKTPDASVSTVSHTMRLEQVGDRFQSPVYVTSPPGDSRLFVVEQAGRIRVVKSGIAAQTPFLDIRSRVKTGGEQGLLSVAFHPSYRTNGFFYVNFTDKQGDTRIERFKAGANPDVADSASSLLILKIDQPYANHNGGLVMFGPDGMLYIGMGDGGSAGDPKGSGQNRNALLGKILRINVSRQDPYTIPVDNPYANGAEGKPEVWATGIRNPWRFAFDRSAGLMYIADVGQNQTEEVDVVPASRAGVNYGWNSMEAASCYRPSSGCKSSGLELPVLTYGHSGGACSITGGFVYRGRRLAAIAGHYFYADYCTGWIRSFKYENRLATDRREWKTDRNAGHIVSFGEDGAGELYVVAEGGQIYRIAGVS